MRVLLMVLSLVLGSLALAGAAELLAEGRFDQAYEAALAEGDYVLAARAASYYAMYQAEGRREKEAWFQRAREAAERAIAEDPKNPEAYFELARALGRLAQYRGVLESLSLAQAVRENLERALELRPDYASALVALAVWNLELAKKGVGWLYGASTKRVLPLFERALELEPQGIIHRYEYARALLRLGRKEEAKRELRALLTLPPKDARDRYVLEEAQNLLEELGE